jgi:hypothetical protein
VKRRYYANMVADRTLNQQCVNFPQFMYRKLNALDKISKILGIFTDKLPERELSERWARYGHIVPLLLLRITNDTVPGYSRIAASRLLDYIIPEWRKHADARVLGYVVGRNSPEVRAWRKAVLERDEYKCVKCGSTNKLHAHHILHWAVCPEARITIDNGLTLCHGCHSDEHRKLSVFA